MNRKITCGMVGGGVGSFIGAVHRRGMALDGKIDLVAGCFSDIEWEIKETGEKLGIDKDRVYMNYQEMAEKEASRKDCIDFVSIVTPNFLHYPIAKKFLQNGINVVCDKPLTINLEEALDLVELAKKNGLIFGLTHVYTGFVMVRQAREMVREGMLGGIRIIQLEYPQEWLSTKVEDQGVRQAVWRTDPAKSGPSAVLADIGTHAIHTARYITGLEVEEVSADLTTFVKGRKLDDNAHVMLRYEKGAKGMLWASQCAPGTENDCKVRIFGEKGSLEWKLRWPNELTYSPLDGPHQILSRGRGEMKPLAAFANRLPEGHADGLHDAFGIIYRDVADAIMEQKYEIKADPLSKTYPTAEEGARMIKFIEACLASNKNKGAWTSAKIDL